MGLNRIAHMDYRADFEVNSFAVEGRKVAAHMDYKTVGVRKNHKTVVAGSLGRRDCNSDFDSCAEEPDCNNYFAND